jgi:dihydroflavonol-4-reductase
MTIGVAGTPPPSGDTVFVSGGSGFVGAAVIRRLVAEGYKVRALARSRASVTTSGIADIIEGDLRDPAAVALAMQGARYAFHVAADYRLWVPDPETMLAINVEGTRTVMRAALAARVERIVHTSSVATLSLDHDGRSSDETRPGDPDTAIGIYKKSKVLGERVVEAMVRDNDLPAVIVNPSTPVGAFDVKPTPTGRMIIEAAAGRMPAYVDTGLNLVHVDDVAEGHLAALRSGRTGERYILGGENVSMGDMLREIAAIVGRKGSFVSLPIAPLVPMAYLSEAMARLTGRTPMLTRDALKMARYKMFFSSDKARRELGYAPRPHAEGLKEAIAWFRQAGLL